MCLCLSQRDTHRQKGRTKGLRTRSKEQKERKREGGMRRSSMREGTRKRKCFVCGCFVRMNASMQRHACLYRVNTHVLVESVPGAKQIDGEDKQTDRIISVPITPRPASVSQSLSHAAAASGGKTGSCLSRRLDRQTDWTRLASYSVTVGKKWCVKRVMQVTAWSQTAIVAESLGGANWGDEEASQGYIFRVAGSPLKHLNFV